jgi:hypothetical protein
MYTQDLFYNHHQVFWIKTSSSFGLFWIGLLGLNYFGLDHLDWIFSGMDFFGILSLDWIFFGLELLDTGLAYRITGL